MSVNLLNQLPEDPLIHILQFLDPIDMFTCTHVSRTMRLLAEECLDLNQNSAMQDMIKTARKAGNVVLTMEQAEKCMLHLINEARGPVKVICYPLSDPGYILSAMGSSDDTQKPMIIPVLLLKKLGCTALEKWRKTKNNPDLLTISRSYEARVFYNPSRNKLNLITYSQGSCISLSRRNIFNATSTLPTLYPYIAHLFPFPEIRFTYRLPLMLDNNHNQDALAEEELKKSADSGYTQCDQMSWFFVQTLHKKYPINILQPLRTVQRIGMITVAILGIIGYRMWHSDSQQ